MSLKWLFWVVFGLGSNFLAYHQKKNTHTMGTPIIGDDGSFAFGLAIYILGGRILGKRDRIKCGDIENILGNTWEHTKIILLSLG